MMKNQITVLACVLLASGCASIHMLPLPAGVTYAHSQSGHRYTIAGLYTNGCIAKMPPADVYDFYTGFIPGCTTVSVDRAKHVLSFATDHPLTNIVATVNDLAKFAGDLPYWEELESRAAAGLPTETGLYMMTTNAAGRLVGRNASSNLTWHSISWQPGREDISVVAPIRYAPRTVGVFKANRSTAFCMCHNRYAIRILDNQKNCLWQDQENVYGSCGIAIVDLNDDGVDEIVVERWDHGREAALIFERGFQQAESTVPVKAAPSASATVR